MPDRIIVGGDHQLRVLNLYNLGFKPYEIASILGLPEQRVNLLIRAIDNRDQFTTTNC